MSFTPPRISNFFKYFINNFQKLALKKLIATCYKNDQPDLFSQNKSSHGIYFENSGEQTRSGQRLPEASNIKPRELKGDGDPAFCGRQTFHTRCV